MTYCDTLAEPIKKKVEVEKKNLDQIAQELCGSTVKMGRRKVVRIIKELLGKQYLIDHANTLGYDPSKAVRKKGTSCELKQKIVSEEDRENQAKPQNINRGTKVSETQPCEEKAITQGDPRKKIYRLRARKDTLTSDPGKEQALSRNSVDFLANTD